MAKRHKRQTNKIITVRGKGPLNAALTSTNAAGAFVSTRYEIDTTLLPSWGQLGQSFTKWRVKSLVLHFAPLKGSTTEGNMGICVLPDPEETTPTTTSSALSMQYSTFGSIRQNLSLRYKPPHSTWLFTRDAALQADRLEMPGEIVYWSENCTASFVPGVPWCSYVVEFCNVTNSSVAPMLKNVPLKNNTITGDNEPSSQNKPVSQVSECKSEADSTSLALKVEIANLKMELANLTTKLSKLEE